MLSTWIPPYLMTKLELIKVPFALIRCQCDSMCPLTELSEEDTLLPMEILDRHSHCGRIRLI